MKLQPHPRLYLNTEKIENIRANLSSSSSFLNKTRKQLEEHTISYVPAHEPEYPKNTHNEHLLRARSLQKIVLSLICRFFQTGDDLYKQATVDYIRIMKDWQYWSWITWREKNDQADAIFDLSYGENSATLAIAYDLLFDELSDDEKKMFVAVAERPFASWRKNAASAWWLGKEDCNWNTVCAGGMAMLALAMYEEFQDDAAEIYKLAEQSMTPFFDYLDRMDGGWPEGIGYWNYGMRYAFMYVLSAENALAEPHPFMKQAGTEKTLFFPVDFCPQGISGGFGDANNWRPMPFHYAVAQRLNHPELAADLLNLAQKTNCQESNWPDYAEWLFVVNAQSQSAEKTHSSAPQQERLKIYKNLDWGKITNSPEQPTCYLTWRGGTTNVPHSHCDLMSFNYFLNGERMVVNTSCGPYIDTTFSPRRWELQGMNALSKNTLLINGVGIAPGTELVATNEISLNEFTGIRMDASQCYGEMRSSGTVRFAGRVFLLIPEQQSILIIDHVELTHVGLVESRMHTEKKVKETDYGYILEGEQTGLSVGYAANVACQSRTAVTAPVQITSVPQTVLRYATVKQQLSVTIATMLSPEDRGDQQKSLSVKHDNERIIISFNAGMSVRKLELSRELKNVT